MPGERLELIDFVLNQTDVLERCSRMESERKDLLKLYSKIIITFIITSHIKSDRYSFYKNV